MRKIVREAYLCALAILVIAVVAFAQGARGKAEMKAGSGSITIDYGQPLSRGQDRVGELPVGDFWRMGMDSATVLKTPVNLMFGATKVAAGAYSLWLKRTAADKFELVFNSQTGQWGTEHDPSKDVTSVPMKKEALASLVEKFQIDLKPTAGGGAFVLSWGKSRLTSDFATR